MTATPTVSELLGQAQAALATFDRARAHQLLTEVIQRDSNNENAWSLLSGLVSSPQDRRNCLERVLQINPHNISARKGLAELNQGGSYSGTAAVQSNEVPQKKSSNIGLLLLLIVLGCGALGMLNVLGGGSSGGSSAAVRSTGTNAHLVSSGGANVIVAVDKAAFDAFNKAATANDRIGIAELVANGRIFAVPNNTAALVLDPGVFQTKVRIMDGEHVGAAGYVAADWVK